MKRILIIFLAAGLMLFAGFSSAYASDTTYESTSDTESIAVGLSVMTPPIRTEYSAFDLFEPEGLVEIGRAHV